MISPTATLTRLAAPTGRTTEARRSARRRAPCPARGRCPADVGCGSRPTPAAPGRRPARAAPGARRPATRTCSTPSSTIVSDDLGHPLLGQVAVAGERLGEPVAGCFDPVSTISGARPSSNSSSARSSRPLQRRRRRAVVLRRTQHHDGVDLLTLVLRARPLTTCTAITTDVDRPRPRSHPDQAERPPTTARSVDPLAQPPAAEALPSRPQACQSTSSLPQHHHRLEQRRPHRSDRSARPGPAPGTSDGWHPAPRRAP